MFIRRRGAWFRGSCYGGAGQGRVSHPDTRFFGDQYASIDPGIGPDDGRL